MHRYVLRDLMRNPRRTLASVLGIALAVGLFSGVSFFVDSSSAQMTARAISPVVLDMQAGLTNPLGTAPTSPSPVTSNAPPPPTQAQLIAAVAGVAGVRAAEGFASVELPAGSVRGPSGPVTGAITLMGFNASYLQSFPLVRTIAGQYTATTGLVSLPTSDLVGARPDSTITVSLPGRAVPLSLRVGATADFTRATPLFLSRSPDTQGEFVASPYVVAVDLATFRDVVIPALRADAAATPPVLKAPPIVEVHAGIDRTALAADPATALVTTEGLRRTIERLAPGDITVVDNLSSTLTGAQRDSTLAKVLFIFLGLPGVALAAYLSRYAGSLLAEAQRRERATLRARGMRPRAMLRALALNTLVLAVLGSVVGLALGFGALALLFNGVNGDGGAYAVSIGLSLAAAAVTTALALYLPARRSLLGEVSDERREMEVTRPAGWLRHRVDLYFLAAAAVVGLVTYLSGGFKPPVTAAADTQSVSLSFYLLLAPAFLWIGATLLAVRGLLALAARLSTRISTQSFRKRLVARTALLSVLRRPRGVAAGIIALSLAIAFGMSVSMFARTYQAEKVTDARFVNGADVRVTPTSSQKQPAGFASALSVPGVRAVSPVIETASVLVGTDKRTLAAIDPATFPSVATINPSFLVGITPAAALSTLASNPAAVLIDQELARTFNIAVGDHVRVRLPNPGGGAPIPVTLLDVGSYTNFPGFPQGVDIVSSMAGYHAAVPAATPTLYLLDTGGNDTTSTAAAAALRSGPGRTTPLLIDTISTAVNRDQSTLSALNIDGLARLEGLYTVLLSALGIAIFVFGLLLRRRKEHITLRALGMRMRQLVALIVAEALLVAVASIVLGALVGTAMALIFVQILRPLFTIPPTGVTVPALSVTVLLALVLVVAVAASLVAGAVLRRTRLVDVLREE
ncbi:MAG: FtsX-like permease family protein [Candidatus Dormibacteraeota bacterium]|uniref:FtsX-like permease family protein n=1 Tax=Candidatus Amunia macphersoniae TaxID=3127014 RepID=A0A934KEJ0_9BACT|nr:FtsX-like permease family protein [Candidatus Dormibacteraeota bacterium]